MTTDTLTEDVTLRSLAREAMETANNDVQKAHPLFLASIKAQEAFYKEFIGSIVDRICLDELHQVIRKDRAATWEAAEAVRTAGPAERIAALARANLLNFVLPNGKRIGAASGAECTDHGENYLKQGKTMCHLGRWLRLVGQSVPAGKRVSKVLSEERLHELREEAEKNEDE